MASDNNLSSFLNPQSSKASKPINKLIMPLSIIEEEGENKKNIIIMDKGIKKRSVSLGVMPKKYKQPKSLILIDRLSDWIVSDY